MEVPNATSRRASHLPPLNIKKLSKYPRRALSLFMSGTSFCSCETGISSRAQQRGPKQVFNFTGSSYSSSELETEASTRLFKLKPCQRTRFERPEHLEKRPSPVIIIVFERNHDDLRKPNDFDLLQILIEKSPLGQ
ncbi:hypothetical protein NC652_028457 [Populus alba x Populus x berolinensis]|nr:hypothetical protein NC652_028457 [Populus alba x Populus x berolinensis]